MLTESAPSWGMRATRTLPRARSRQVLADVVRADGEFAVPAVDEDGELHRRGPADVRDGFEGRADGASRVEHVVHQDDDGAVDPARGDVGGLQHPDGLGAQVVAVHRDVEGSGRDVRPAGLGQGVAEPVRQGDAAGGDAQEDEVLRPPVFARGFRARCA